MKSIEASGRIIRQCIEEIEAENAKGHSLEERSKKNVEIMARMTAAAEAQNRAEANAKTSKRLAPADVERYESNLRNLREEFDWWKTHDVRDEALKLEMSLTIVARKIALCECWMKKMPYNVFALRFELLFNPEVSNLFRLFGRGFIGLRAMVKSWESQSYRTFRKRLQQHVRLQLWQKMLDESCGKGLSFDVAPMPDMIEPVKERASNTAETVADAEPLTLAEALWRDQLAYPAREAQRAHREADRRAAVLREADELAALRHAGTAADQAAECAAFAGV